MKAALLIVLSLSAVALAGPAFNKNIDIGNKNTQDNKQQQQYLTTSGDATKQTQTVELLKQWCFSSQMSQPQLTDSFKKLVDSVRSSPIEQSTEAAVMGERICQNARPQKSQQQTGTGSDNMIQQADAQAHELIKDVYMDALISCKSAQCTEQLLKIIQSNKVDNIRASYYMTRMAVGSDSKDSVKDEQEVKQFVESFIQSAGRDQSESIERQKMLAATSLIGKLIKQKEQQQQISAEIKQLTEQVAKTIVERFIKPVSSSDIQQYQQQQSQSNEQLVKKIAKRSAALKALANIPSWMLAECQIDDVLIQLSQDKQELVTVRQSAIECLEQSDKALESLKQIAFDQDEPIEVRVAAYRALMTVVYAPATSQQQQKQQQAAEEVLDKVVKHCAEERNQQQDDQFVLYVVSHLDNVRTSKQPEMAAIKESIQKNKQHYMQIQVLYKKLKEQLADVRKSSRNYKLEQDFQQIDTGLIIEGDLIYESANKINTNSNTNSNSNSNFNSNSNMAAVQLPKLVRVNMSMPVMGETVNVVEVTIRQNQMDEELLGALKIVQKSSISKEGVSKVVDSFKSGAGKAADSAEADLTVKIDGTTVLYLCAEDFKTSARSSAAALFQGNARNTRSIYQSRSIVDEILEHLKRRPIAFNRGFNFNVNERLAKLIDVDANVIAGLRFESRVSQQTASSHDFEIAAQIEPRFSFEAIVGPSAAGSAKLGNKKLLQRLSTKSAIGMRYRFKKDELVDVQIELPMNTMELFSFETQLVQKNQQSAYNSYDSYTYLPDSIYGQEDIYSAPLYASMMQTDDFEQVYGQRLAKRSVFGAEKKGVASYVFGSGKKSSEGAVKRVSNWISAQAGAFAHSYETPEKVARATGLRGKLRVVASPRDMSLLVKCLVQKYDAQMSGYRMRVQSQQAAGNQKQYQLVLSTPNSAVERSLKLQLVKQSSMQRTVVKVDVESSARKMAGASGLVELVHDGRQFAVKAELVSKASGQRHLAECGFVRGSSQASGRVAASYKPYVTVESSYLRRPVQLQGVVSYTQSPKSVISYELKCPTSGDFVQGKIIVDARQSHSAALYRKRSSTPFKRSMRSPVALLLEQDVTMTAELVGQVQQHAAKVHQMLEWDASKMAYKFDAAASYKNARRPAAERQLKASVQLEPEQQVIAIERRFPQEARKDVRVQLASDFRSPTAHQMSVEARYQGRRAAQAISSYKHKVEFVKIGPKKVDCSVQVELVDSERQISEKLQGRARVALERQLKQISAELAAKDKLAKVEVEFESVKKHTAMVVVKTATFAHKHEQRADSRKLTIESRTDKFGQPIAKLLVEVDKQQPAAARIVVEAPKKAVHMAAELRLESGRASSLAVQTPRFASKAEFSFESAGRYASKWNPFNTNYRFKSDLKDLVKKDAYWMDTALNYAADAKDSYFRFDSPMYRSEFEFAPRAKLAKLALAARNKRSVDQFESIYANKDSLLGAFDFTGANTNTNSLNKLALGNKMWMLRSLVSGASPLDQIKREARRALFEYADRRQSHKQTFEWNPNEERVAYELEHEGADWTPVRMSGDLSTSWSRPSRLALSSGLVDLEMDARPFDGEQTFAKLVATSRHRRSPFKKHETEYRYSKHHGHKATMKHEDAEGKRHALKLDADAEPKKWAKLAYEGDKLGKLDGEYNWRRHVTKREHDAEPVYANKATFWRQSADQQKEHRGQLDWQEPVKMAARPRRSATDLGRFSPVEYLKHVDARLSAKSSQLGANKAAAAADLFNVDFDYKPQLGNARLSVQTPDELMHETAIDFKPHERAYKLASKLYSARTGAPVYELSAGTKGALVANLAAAEQEPVFVHADHQLLEQPIESALYRALFKQPLKLDYSDKYGRVASLDYDHSPLATEQAAKMLAGLRQKRAAIYYKDAANDFEHSTAYDFYPESHFGSVKQAYKTAPFARLPGDLSLKTATKYGPVSVRADTSDPKSLLVECDTPLVRAKMSVEAAGPSAASKLIKLVVDNKQQRVELAKMVRKSAPALAELEPVREFARAFDAARFEHSTELLVNLVERIVKLKSRLASHERAVFTLEGECAGPKAKCYAKIDGERVEGELVADLINKSASLALNLDEKRTLQHVTRLVRISDKFYALESSTAHKAQPIFKLSAKISAMIFEEPAHLFASGRNERSAHVSTFEAVVYEPKEVLISGQYDCLKKEARVQTTSVAEKKVQETIVKYDDDSQSVVVDARLASPYGQQYVSKAKINVPTIVKGHQCHRRQPNSCQSELVYADKSGNYNAKLVPGHFVAINTPTYKKTFDWANWAY